MSIYGNTAASDGSGVFVFGNTSTLVKLNSSTVYNNLADNGGGVLLDSSVLELTHVTIANNRVRDGGGVGVRRGGIGPTLRLRNSIFFNTRSEDGTAPRNECGGGRQLSVGNISDDGTCGGTEADPLLSGPTGFPPYCNPQGSSPAIGAGAATYCAEHPTDQAGRSRPSSGCDLGAVQYVAPSVSRSGGGASDRAEETISLRSIPTGYALINAGYQLWAQYGFASGVQF